MISSKLLCSPQLPEYTLGEGDIIDIVVLKNSSLSKQLVITPDGKINYPLVGEIKAAGLTVKQLQDYIRKDLALTVQNPEVTVILTSAKSYKIYVLGEVIRSGVYELKGPVTVIQAIAMAGGFTPYAARHKIKVFNSKNTKRQFRFNYKAYLSGNNTQQNIMLRAGDTILVP